jgi:hypothetical protein
VKTTLAERCTLFKNQEWRQMILSNIKALGLATKCTDQFPGSMTISIGDIKYIQGRISELKKDKKLAIIN